MSTQFKLRIIKKIKNKNAQMQKYFLEVKTFRFSLILEKDFLLAKWRIKNIETNILLNLYFR
jgi:hypothetical protein